MPRHARIAALLTALLLFGTSQTAFGGFKEGMEAYKAGHYAQALKEWKPLAEQGNAEAELYLGSLYFHGYGVPQDYGLAAAWLRKAADQGNLKTENNLGAMYLSGVGVPQDYRQAAFWIRKAAEQGRPIAQEALGSLYERGLGVKKDYHEAAIWYRKAAKQGDQRAQEWRRKHEKSPSAQWAVLHHVTGRVRSEL